MQRPAVFLQGETSYLVYLYFSKDLMPPLNIQMWLNWWDLNHQSVISQSDLHPGLQPTLFSVKFSSTLKFVIQK